MRSTRSVHSCRTRGPPATTNTTESSMALLQRCMTCKFCQIVVLLPCKDELDGILIPFLCDQLSAGQQEALGQNKNIKALHPDVPVSTQQIPKVQKQKNAPWHLDRIDQENLPLDGLYDYTLDGSGINVYILDTVRALSLLSM